MVLATLDVSSPHTNIPQEEEIDVVCRYHQNHYEQKLSIPTNDLRELVRLILEKNRKEALLSLMKNTSCKLTALLLELKSRFLRYFHG